MPKNENFGITSSFGITTNRGYAAHPHPRTRASAAPPGGAGPHGRSTARPDRGPPALATRLDRVPTTDRDRYPLFVVIPKDDVIPKFSFFGIFTGNFPDLEISRDSA